MVEHKIQRSDDVGTKGTAPQNCARRISGSRVRNAIWPPLLKMEAMTKDEKEERIATVAIDSEKHFDSRCWEVTSQMLDRMGLDQRQWKPMLNFIAHLTGFNKVAGTLGPTWTCTNRIIQRCSFSLLETAALSTVWERVLEEEVPTVLCKSIVDDQRLCATGREAPKQLQSAIQITRDFDGTTGTRFNPLKSTCATPTKQMEEEVQQTAEQFGMKIVSFEKQVGYPVTYKGNRDRTNHNKRTDEATRAVAESRVYPKASDSRPGRGSLKRMRSPDTNLPSSAGCRASNPKVRSLHK